MVRRDSIRIKELRKRFSVLQKIVCVNEVMTSLVERVVKVASVAKAVWIGGESGTGKDLFARLVHQCSGRNDKFVTLNVAGIDDHLFSDTLFGHVKGAFTGADRDRPGLVIKAHGGTLFLDEIGDLSMASQTKLLRLIENREFMSLGANNVSKADVLIVVATHQSLPERVRDGKFRKDLYFRICTHLIELPPLRERLDEVDDLATYFAKQFALENNRPIPKIGKNTLSLLHDYDFPGNIRELKCMIDDAAAMGVQSLDLDALKAMVARHRLFSDSGSVDEFSTAPLFRTLKELPTQKEIKDNLFAEAFRRTGGNQTRMAEILGISQAAISKRIKLKKDKQNR